MTLYKDRVYLYPYSNNIVYIVDDKNAIPKPFLKINNTFSDTGIKDLNLQEFIEICKNKCYHGIFNFHIICDTYIYTRAGESIRSQIITDIKTNESYFHPLPMIANGYDDEYEYFLLDLSIYEDIKDRFSTKTSKLKNDIEKLIHENHGKESNPLINSHNNFIIL